LTCPRILALFVCPHIPRAIDGGISRVLQYWCKSAQNQFRGSDDIFDVQEISGPDVTREQVCETLSTYEGRPGLVAFYGHGCGCATSLLTAGSSDEGFRQVLGPGELGLLHSKIVYAVACHSGRDLGPRAYEAGAKGYIGYSRHLIMGRGNVVPRGYGEAANAGLLPLRYGRTLGEAWAAIATQFERWAIRYAEGDIDDRDHGLLLLNNQESLVCFGCASSRLGSPSVLG